MDNGWQLTIYLHSGANFIVRFFGEYAKAQAEKHAEQILYEKKRSNHIYKIEGGKVVTPLIIDALFVIDTTEVAACVAQEAPSIVIQMPVKNENV
jgi:hypothetical protein